LPLYDSRYQQQLLVGGRLFVVVGAAPVMEARLVRRISDDQWIHESLFETVVDPLVHASRPEVFSF
jgi:protein-L-isoaspartate(D-aspartate) O-methyltransferase